MTKTRIQASRTLGRKGMPPVQTPTPLQGAHREFSDLTNSSVPDIRIVTNVNVWCRMVTALKTSNLEHIWWQDSSGLAILPKLKEICDGCILDMFLLRGTQLLVNFRENCMF